jgi:ribonucleotide reductase alpha subunit
MAQVFNHRALGQPGRETEGAFAMYLEPWHADIMSFVDLGTAAPARIAPATSSSRWVPDLFMRRVESGGDWSLFVRTGPAVPTRRGAEFDELY